MVKQEERAAARATARARPRGRALSRVAPAIAAVALLTGAASFLTMRTERTGVPTPRVLPEAPVTAMDQGVGLANNSPSLVADPTEPRFVALANRLDAPDFGCALQVSGDGGRGWVTAAPVTELPPGADKCYAPEVAFDRHGVLYYLFVGLTGEGNEPMGAFLTTSADRARTFTRPREVLGPLNFGVRMAIDPSIGSNGRIHLVWLHATSDPPLGGFGPPPNPILAAHSDDGGATFSEPVQVSDPARQRVVAPALALGPDRAVHVAYYDLEDDARDYQGLEGPTWEGTWSLVLSSSFDGGRTFGPGPPVDAAVVPPERVMLIFTMPPPSLAATGERVCTAWTDGRHGDADAFLRCSADGGRTWQQERRLNDDPIGNGRTQGLPRISASPGGRIDAIFLDRRDDPENLRNHVYFTFSDDGGATFAANTRLTQDSSDSRIGQEYVNAAAKDKVELGSRLALLSERSRVLAAWPDTRNSRFFTRGQDLFAATVILPSARRDLSVGRLAALALAVGGGIALGLVVLRRYRLRSRPVTRLAALLAVAAAGISCTSTASGAPLPASPPVVVVTMRDFHYELTSEIPAGRVVFRFVNAGAVEHRPSLLPLPDELPPIDQQLRGDERAVVTPFAGVPLRQPGETGTFAVDLAPGQRYAIVCFARGPDGESHALKGMASEFRPAGEPGQGTGS